jgi:hypothetical protein
MVNFHQDWTFGSGSFLSVVVVKPSFVVHVFVASPQETVSYLVSVFAWLSTMLSVASVALSIVPSIASSIMPSVASSSIFMPFGMLPLILNVVGSLVKFLLCLSQIKELAGPDLGGAVVPSIVVPLEGFHQVECWHVQNPLLVLAFLFHLMFKTRCWSLHFCSKRWAAAIGAPCAHLDCLHFTLLQIIEASEKSVPL